VDLIEDVYKRCNWNRKRSELEMHRHCGDHHLAICMSTSINLIYKDAVGTSPQRLFDAVRWSLSTRHTLAYFSTYQSGWCLLQGPMLMCERPTRPPHRSVQMTRWMEVAVRLFQKMQHRVRGTTLSVHDGARDGLPIGGVGAACCAVNSRTTNSYLA
jgi:hypothetical protein